MGAFAAAGIGAAGAIGGALISSSAAGNAASTQSAAADRASQAAQAQQAQTRQDLSPFRTAGVDALASLRAALGLPQQAQGGGINASGQPLPAGWSTQNGSDGFMQILTPNGDLFAKLYAKDAPTELGPDSPLQQQINALAAQNPFVPGAPSGVANPLTANGLSGLTFQPTQAALEATPGYQFDLSQGLRGVESSAAARGLGVSGAALKGAAGYATGLANNTLTTQQGIFQQNLNNVLAPLQQLASNGQNAANQTGTLGQAAVNSSNTALIGGANALAAGQVGSANALQSGLNSVGNAANNFQLFNALQNGGAGGGGGVETGTF